MARWLVLLLRIGASALAVLHRPPVPRPAAAVVGRFALRDKGQVVLDRIPGLHWQHGYSAPKMNQANSQAWCAANKQGLPGTGWRLPTVRELQSIRERPKFVFDPTDPFVRHWVDDFLPTPDVTESFCNLNYASTPAVVPGALGRVENRGGGSHMIDPTTIDAPQRYHVRCVR